MSNIVNLDVMKSISFDKAVEIALEQHLAGHFARAEGLYMEILRQDPGNVEAMHLLGVLARQGHQPQAAIDLISAAIRKKPDVPVFHYNLGETFQFLERYSEAIESYRRVIALDPDHFEAMNNLSSALFMSAQFAEAESVARHALSLRTDSTAAMNNLGNALRGLDRAKDSEEILRKAIEIEPRFFEAVQNLSLCLCNQGRFEEGVEQMRNAIRIDPTVAGVHNNLGLVLSSLGRYEEAGGSYETAIALDPKHIEAYNNLGAALKELGKPYEAIAPLKKAVEIDPEFVNAYVNLGVAYNEMGMKQEALGAIEESLKLRPRLARQHFMKGNILRDLFKMDEAIDSLREAYRLEPEDFNNITALGYAMLEQGELEEAKVLLDRCIGLNPDPQSLSNVLMTVNYHPAYTPADHFRVHHRFSALHESSLVDSRKPHRNNRSPSRRLRVAYVSPDFRGHSVAFFLEPILANHDHTQFEVFAYAQIVNTDYNTWRLRTQIDQWRETSGKTSDAIAQQIRDDEIDLLIDLAGHTGGNQLPVFARKPAPVQINMIGFPSTTGLVSMDYRITDANCDPLGQSDAYNSESLIRMPRLFWVYQPPYGSPDVGPLPADQNKHITFTSVNNFTKVTPQVQELWSRLLIAIPNSRLIFQTAALMGEYNQTQVKRRITELGVDPNRLEFRPWSNLTQYMQLLNDSDITLDPFPFNGGTTTCHSLWMGAPVLTLAGDRHASRMGLSMMTAIGLPEFVAYTPEQYVEIGKRFANDLPRLREIRAGMRERLKNSPLLDGPGYTRELEAVYRQVWQKWCVDGL